MTYFVITLLLLPWQLNGVSLCGVFLFIIRQHRLWLKSERRQKNWPPTNKITFTCISTWLYFPFYSFFLYNFSKISCHLQLPLLFSVSIHKLTSFMMQLSFATNIQMVGFQPHLLQSSSSAFSKPSDFWRACGTIEDKILSSITFKSLHLSAEFLFPQSFSLAFCQFSRLSNDLSDRSKSSGWDLRSLRKLGMLHWRIWRLHGNMQWILSFGRPVYVLYLSVYRSGCHPVNWSEYICQAICLFGPWVKSSSF